LGFDFPVGMRQPRLSQNPIAVRCPLAHRGRRGQLSKLCLKRSGVVEIAGSRGRHQADGVRLLARTSVGPRKRKPAPAPVETGGVNLRFYRSGSFRLEDSSYS
jgi:hypothetical protein